MQKYQVERKECEADVFSVLDELLKYNLILLQ